MVLHEHGSEVSWIYAGIIASPLFRIDIPLSSKSVGFGTKASGMESDNEVELAEEFGPSDLLVCEQFSGRKVLKIFMVCNHINWAQQSFEVMTPDFECFKYCEQFLVMDVIVEFGWGKSPRVKGDRMNFAVGQRYGGKNSSKGIVRGIHFNNKRCAWNPVSQDRHGGEGLL